MDKKDLVKIPENSGIYLLVFPTGIKVGCSTNLNRRVSSYLHPWCLPIQQYAYLLSDQPELAEAITIKVFRKILGAPISGSEFFSHTGFEFMTSILPKAVYEADQIAKMPTFELTDGLKRMTISRSRYLRINLNKERLDRINEAADRIINK